MERPLEESVLKQVTTGEIRSAMDDNLDVELRRVLELRSEGKTLKEIGKVLDVTGERVRQMEALAEFKIRNILRHDDV